MKHIRLFSTVSERTSVVNDHPYDNILSYTKENDGLLISQSIPNDEIWYISSEGNVVTPNSTSGFGANIVSNTYTNGKGMIKFDGPVTSIVDNAFRNCTNLVSVTIPDGVTSIGNYAFGDCTGLASIVCMPTTPPILSNTNSFYNTNNCPIYVPAASVDTYKAANNWSKLASRIQAIQS